MDGCRILGGEVLDPFKREAFSSNAEPSKMDQCN